MQSRFYEGWAEFFRTRTTGNVSIDHDRERASVELVTVDTVGEFTLNDVISNDRLNARGQAPGHSLTDFNVTYQAGGGGGKGKGKGGGGNKFNNFYGGFYLESGDKRFEYVVHVPGGVNCNSGIDDSDTLELSMFYRNGSGVQHEWSNDSIPAASGPVRVSCDDGAELVVDLTAGDVTDGQELTYGDGDTSQTNYGWNEPLASDVTFGHSEDTEPTTFGTDASDNDTATTYLLTRHYVALLGNDFTLNAYGQTGGGGKGVKLDKGGSQGVFDYESGSGGTYITYLHVTENEIEVEFE